MKHLHNRRIFLSKKLRINELNISEEEFKKADKKDDIKYSFGAIMLKVPRNDEWNNVLKEIDEEDVYYNEEAPGRFGVEKRTHITVLYGTHDSEIELEDIKETILNRNPINIKMTDISLFENENFDVLKFDIESEDLVKFNKELTDKYPHTNDHGEYHPHATIAYLKSGTGKKYIKKIEEDDQIILDDLVDITYSRVVEDKKEKISIKLKPIEEIEETLNTGSYTNVKKGDKVEVQMNLFKDKPSIEIEAYNDSFFNDDDIEMFSFIHGGDMMMLAKKKEGKWISE